MGVERKPKGVVLSRCIEQEGPQRGIKLTCPVAVAADVALVEVWDEIQHLDAAVVEAVNGVLERFDSVNHRRPPPCDQKPFALAGLPE